MLVRPVSALCAVALVLTYAAESARAAAPAADSTDALKAQFQKALDLVDAGDAGASAAIKDLLLPEPEKWFTATFGELLGKPAAEEYARIVNAAEKEFTGLAKVAKDRGYKVVAASKIDDPKSEQATGGQKAALEAMKQKVALYTVKLGKPEPVDGKTGIGGISIWSFAFVDGKFRLVGKMRAVSIAAEPPTKKAE